MPPGNWIKVVQRVRYAIALRPPAGCRAYRYASACRLHAVVDVRDESGSQLAQRPAEPVLNTDIYAIDMTEIGARIAQIVRDNAPAEATGRAQGRSCSPRSPSPRGLTSNGAR